jgi:DNA-binding transcriptional MerR regulator
MQDQKIQQPKRIKKNKLSELPPIPEKLYFSIGEASRLCGVKPYVLRYWEQEFAQINPSKRRYNRRYYQREDILLLRKIRFLLYEKGFTIEGARAQLEATETPVKMGPSEKPANEFNLDDRDKDVIRDILKELEGIIIDLETEEV